jgi:oligopeptide/dipeptide ABC transporter ATP-binding protein
MAHTKLQSKDKMLLEVDNLAVGFATDAGVARAIDGVSFGLAPGQAFCLVGESGCGKSVTALSIIGLLPRPSSRIFSGSIRFEGRELQGRSAAELNLIRGAKMGMVFQEPMTSLNPVFRVGEQIAEPLRRHLDLSHRAALDEAVALLERVGIAFPEKRSRDYPHQLSGGQRQRVIIAMAMACKPALLIADEPTTALDVSSQGQILLLLRELRASYGSALLMITHDLEVVAQSADSMAVMYAGRIVESGPVTEILSAPLHPYTMGLMASRPRISAGSRHTRLRAIAGTVPSVFERPAGCAFSPRCPEAASECLSAMPELVLADGGTRLCRCWLRR